MGWTPKTAVSLNTLTDTTFTGVSGNVILVAFKDVSISGTDDLLIQIGPSGGVETSGYTALGVNHNAVGWATATSSAGFVIRISVASVVLSGVLTLVNITGNVWVASYSCRKNTTDLAPGGGRVVLSGPIDRVKISLTGANTFDGGKVNVLSAEWNRETVKGTSSGTEHDFTGLPAGIEMAYLVMDQVSLSGTDRLRVQLGDTTGFYTTGYASGTFIRGGATLTDKSNSSNAAGMEIFSGDNTTQFIGTMRLTKPRDHYWVSDHCLIRDQDHIIYGAARRQITNALSQIRLTRTGTNTFDNGQVGLLYT